MDDDVRDLNGRAVKVALAYAAYKARTFRLVEPDLSGMTHLLASRQGLYAFHEQGWQLVAHGFFFGITFAGADIFVFECCDLPRGPTRMGRLVRLRRAGERIVETTILAEGLDNGCHAIDFLDGRLHVVDTYNQRILRFAPDLASHEALCPLPAVPPGGWQDGDNAYRHINSILGVGEHTLLLLHNGARHFGRVSEVAIFNRTWQELARWPLEGTGCHSLAVLEDGTLVTCGSMEGTLLTPGGRRRQVSRYLTRGLAVGAESIVVGGSREAHREGRLHNSGTVSFLDHDWRVRATLEVPGAPMEIRRLDAEDASLTGYLDRLGRRLRMEQRVCFSPSS